MFNNAFESLMSVVTLGKYECIIAGDYNIYFLKSKKHIGTEHFVNILFPNSFVPLITKPTRYSTYSSTLIDNILTNKPQNNLVSGILISDISDHLPVFYISQHITKTNKPTFLLILT